jgi:hypothetical protein
LHSPDQVTRQSGGPWRQWLVGHVSSANKQTGAPDSPLSALDSLIPPHRSGGWPIKDTTTIGQRRTRQSGVGTGQFGVPAKVVVFPRIEIFFTRKGATTRGSFGPIKEPSRRPFGVHKCSQQIYTSSDHILSLPLLFISLVCVEAQL